MRFFNMSSRSPRILLRSLGTQVLSVSIVFVWLMTPVLAQRPAAPLKAPASRASTPLSDPTFDNLLGFDRYKLYGEVRNVGQLMSTGGAAEIVDPIMKLAGPPDKQAQVAEARKEPLTATPGSSPQPPAERLPFVISHAGSLVFISDKSFKFEKLHPAGTRALAEDQNFRVAHDRFPSEPVFLFFNVAL